VKSGDEVLWAYANVDETKHYLKLTGPTLVVPGEPAIYVVTDGRNGSPVKGASLHGKKTDDKGKVAIVFKKLGAHKLKAEKKPDSIRSNELVVHAVVTFRGPTAKL
jgi:hypothetical protein